MCQDGLSNHHFFKEQERAACTASSFQWCVAAVIHVHKLSECCCCAEIPTLVFLTKIDKYDPDVIGEDLSKTFHSARLLSLMEVSFVFAWLCSKSVLTCGKVD